jgi:hypothetical protein
MDSRGSAAFTASLAADGTLAAIEGPRGARAATQAFNLMLPVLTGWASGELSALPELPLADPELDRLEAGERTGGAKAALAVAAHLVERLAERRDHAAAARRRLDEVLDRRESGLGLEAARLWLRWAAVVFPDGLPAEAKARRTALHGWVNSLPPSPKRDAVLAGFGG